MALGTLSRDSSQMESRSLGRASSSEGVRSKTPPGTPKKCGKLFGVRVHMLDDSVTLFQVQVRRRFTKKALKAVCVSKCRVT